MTQVPVIDTHRHILGKGVPDLLHRAGLYDPSKPLPQVDNGSDLFFYKDWIDTDYAIGVQREAGVTKSMVSTGGEVELPVHWRINPDPVSGTRLFNEEHVSSKEKYPNDVEIMADVHALYEKTRAIAEEFISKHGAKGLSVASSYGHGPDQLYLDAPRAEWLWEYAESENLPVHIHPPLLAIGQEVALQYKMNETTTRPSDTGITLARLIHSGIFDRYPKVQVVAVHMGGTLPSIIGRLDFSWRLNYDGIENPLAGRPMLNTRRPSEYCRTNINVDCMGFNPWQLRAAVDLYGIDRIIFGSDYGPVPISPKEHIDLVRQVVPDPADQEKIFWRNTDRLFGLGMAAAVAPKARAVA